MKFTTQAIALGVMGFSAVISLHHAPAIAFTITRNNNPFTLLSNLLGDTTGLSNFNIRLTGDGRAFGIFQDDPFNLKSGVLLSTGRVTDIAGINTIDGGTSVTSGLPNDLSTDFGLPGPQGDSISMQIDFDADNTAEKLFFQFVFGSEEFVEFGGRSFNDSFSLELNGFNLARLSNGASVSINNLVPSPLGPYHPDFIYNPVGTGPASNQTRLDGYTKPLLFTGDLNQNARNTLVVRVRDVGDGLFDSAVLIKGGTLGTVEPPPIPQPGTSIPEPSSVFGLFVLGALGAACGKSKLKSKVSRSRYD